MSIAFPMILLRLVVALLLGAIIGFERESHEHAAGMRTNALVALSSCLFMIISIYGFSSVMGIPHVQLDPSRVASYVVAGIGFLGAGSIFRSQAQDQERVKGLTTAASIWIVAAIGLACGGGMLLEALGTTLLALAVLILLRFVEKILSARRPASLHTISLETTSMAGQLVGSIYDTCTHINIGVEALEVRKLPESATITVTCKLPDATTLTQIIGELQALPGVCAVQADLRHVMWKKKTPKVE